MTPRTAKQTLLALVAAPVVLLSCATQRPVVVNFPNHEEGNATITYPKTSVAPRAGARIETTVNVPLTEFRVPEGQAPKASQPTTNDSRELVASSNVRLVVHPQLADYQGGAVVYPYIPNHVYQLFTAPLELSDIRLEPGEQIVSTPASGDTANFLVATGFSGANGQKVEQVFVKPIYPGKQTTLIINTDKRTYIFQVYSFEETYMPLVTFQYPLEQMQRQSRELAQSSSQPIMSGDVSSLDFNYKIIPHTLSLPAWAPSIVFTDGTKTYIDFPSAERAAYAPVLFALNNKGQRVLTNYRVEGTYYVVDEVLEHAELAINTDDGNVITIIRTDR